MNFQNYNDVFNKDNYPKFRNITKQDGFLAKGYDIIPEDYAPCLCLSGKNSNFVAKKSLNKHLKAF